MTEDLDNFPTYWHIDFNINKIVDEKVDLTHYVINLFNRENYVPSLQKAKYIREEQNYAHCSG